MLLAVLPLCIPAPSQGRRAGSCKAMVCPPAAVPPASALGLVLSWVIAGVSAPLHEQRTELKFHGSPVQMGWTCGMMSGFAWLDPWCLQLESRELRGVRAVGRVGWEALLGLYGVCVVAATQQRGDSRNRAWARLHLIPK